MPRAARRPDVSDEAAAVLERLRDGSGGADELARATGLDAAELAAALDELELAGARRAGGGGDRRAG